MKKLYLVCTGIISLVVAHAAQANWNVQFAYRDWDTDPNAYFWNHHDRVYWHRPYDGWIHNRSYQTGWHDVRAWYSMYDSRYWLHREVTRCHRVPIWHRTECDARGCFVKTAWKRVCY